MRTASLQVNFSRLVYIGLPLPETCQKPHLWFLPRLFNQCQREMQPSNNILARKFTYICCYINTEFIQFSIISAFLVIRVFLIFSSLLEKIGSLWSIKYPGYE